MSTTRIIRCPSCNKIGSPALNGYCRICAPKPESDKGWIGNHWVRDKFPIERELIPTGEYGARTSKYGYER